MDWNVVDVFVTTSGMILIIMHVVKLCFAACVVLRFMIWSEGVLYNLAGPGDYRKAVLMIYLSLIP